MHIGSSCHHVELGMLTMLLVWIFTVIRKKKKEGPDKFSLSSTGSPLLQDKQISDVRLSSSVNNLELSYPIVGGDNENNITLLSSSADRITSQSFSGLYIDLTAGIESSSFFRINRSHYSINIRNFAQCMYVPYFPITGIHFCISCNVNACYAEYKYKHR